MVAEDTPLSGNNMASPDDMKPERLEHDTKSDQLTEETSSDSVRPKSSTTSGFGAFVQKMRSLQASGARANEPQSVDPSGSALQTKDEAPAAETDVEQKADEVSSQSSQSTTQGEASRYKRRRISERDRKKSQRLILEERASQAGSSNEQAAGIQEPNQASAEDIKPKQEAAADRVATSPAADKEVAKDQVYAVQDEQADASEGATLDLEPQAQESSQDHTHVHPSASVEGDPEKDTSHDSAPQNASVEAIADTNQASTASVAPPLNDAASASEDTPNTRTQEAGAEESLRLSQDGESATPKAPLPTPRADQRRAQARFDRRMRKIIAILVLLICLVVGIFSWNRWWRFDDFQDMQGEWELQSRDATMIIDGDKLELTRDAVLDLRVDSFTKTIYFSLGDLQGQGLYEFSPDRNTLTILEGHEANMFTILGLVPLSSLAQEDAKTETDPLGGLSRLDRTPLSIEDAKLKKAEEAQRILSQESPVESTNQYEKSEALKRYEDESEIRNKRSRKDKRSTDDASDDSTDEGTSQRRKRKPKTEVDEKDESEKSERSQRSGSEDDSTRRDRQRSQDEGGR